MTKLVNRAKMTTATTGTGTLTLGSAVDGYQTFAAAGVVDADVVRYVIEDGTDWEIGTGTYTATGTTLTRTVIESSNSDAAISLSGNAVVFVTAASADIVQPDEAQTLTNKTLDAPVVTNDLTIADKIVHSGDTNTSIRFPAADTVTVETSGAERLRIDSSGNVGIGTTSPSRKLVIEDASSAPFISVQGASGAEGGILWGTIGVGDAQGQLRYNNSSNYMTFSTSSAERLRIDASGNLGLGVTPSAWSSGQVVFQNKGGALSSGSAVEIYLGQNVYYGGSPFADRYVNNGFATSFGQSSGKFTWRVAPFGTAGDIITFTQAMTLSNSGNNTSLALQNPVATQTTTLASSDLYFDFSVAGAVVWRNKTSAGESARIDSSGNLLVGRTSSIASGLRVQIETNDATPLFLNRTNTSGVLALFDFNGSDVGSISTNGTSTAYNTSSDYRLKENVAPMQNALATIAQLNPVTYTWKADGSAGQGFIAHELQAVVPDCVTGEKDAVDAEGNPQYQGVDTSFLVATLVKAIQELTARVAELENR